ncbi:D-alanyl-D-alanine carboxypeptidase [Streptomyces sp. 3211.6]|uniref:serine hydrolase domain-containing protein n=1 Tax=Streptomyces sp. 3211.6 TaxID=1938845 RepID=UPI000C2CD5ED|nr:serine hydrolase domain-containing protein [Streptomyces sp. 3211.6]RKT08633.1 D-alanyl-D-alanine carboxypeptidase [Streptomyces sp. 3211.6]
MSHADKRQRLCRKACVGLAAAGLLALPAASALAHAPQPAPQATLSAEPSPSGGFPALDDATAAKLDRAVQDVLKKTGVPGVIVGISAPGKGEYTRAFGVADKATRQPMAADFYSRIGSETKTFTVTALLQLAQQGKVGLDDPIGKYVDGVPNGDKVTLRELAGMRSGLLSYTATQSFYKALTTDPTRRYTPQELLDYAFKAPKPVIFAPNAQFNYSNTNLILLGLVVEKESGQPLSAYIRDHILRPAGMSRTSFPDDASFPTPHAHGYTQQTATGKTEDATDWNPSWGWAAGAMISDLPDLRIWAKTLATGVFPDGTRMVSPEMQKQRLDTPPTSIPGAGYGLGIFDVQGWIGHNGSLPGYQSLTMYLPGQQATMVVLLNTDIPYGPQQEEPSTVFGQALTRVLTPDHVYNLPAAAQKDMTPPPTP